MPKKFDQDAKDRVVRLVEDRILAENISMQEACKIVVPKVGVRGILPGSGRRPLDVQGALLSACRKTWRPKMPGYVAKTRSLVTPMSC